MSEYVVKYGQQLEDVALIAYGTMVGVAQLCRDNALDMDSLLYPGQILQIREFVPELTDNNRVMLEVITKEGIVPVSGVVGEKPNEGYAAEDYFGEDYNYN